MPPLPRHWVHYTDRSFARVDATQVFHVELFSADGGKYASRTHITAGLCQTASEFGPVRWSKPPDVGKRLHSVARKVLFRTHELPRLQKAIILLSCSLERPRVAVHSAPDYQRYWLDRREQNEARRNGCVIIFQRREWIP